MENPLENGVLAPSEATLALLEATERCNLYAAKKALDAGGDPFARPVDREGCAHWVAIHRRWIEGLRLFAERATEERREKMLFTAVDLTQMPYVGNFPDVYIAMLIDLGVNPNAQNAQGETPLFKADRESMRLLIRRGANPKHQNNRGQTVLHYIRENGLLYDEVVGHGADPSIEDNEGNCPVRPSTCVIL